MISDVLIEDHRSIHLQLERALDAIRAGKTSLEELQKLRKALRRHIYFEETLLFRLVENDDNRSRINGLEAEHGGILQLIDKIEDYISRDDLTRAVDRAEGLARVLESHDEIEVSTIYQDLDRSERIDRNSFIDDFNKTTVPEDWISRVQSRYSGKKNSS